MSKGELVNVDFLFLDPNPGQFHSVKLLINSLLDGMSYKSSALADIICNQVNHIKFEP
jgi:protein BCP1